MHTVILIGRRCWENTAEWAGLGPGSDDQGKLLRPNCHEGWSGADFHLEETGRVIDLMWNLVVLFSLN